MPRLAQEVRRTLVDLDEVEKELKKAAKAIDAAAGLTGKHRVRLQSICDNAAAPKRCPNGRRTAALLKLGTRLVEGRFPLRWPLAKRTEMAGPLKSGGDRQARNKTLVDLD